MTAATEPVHAPIGTPDLQLLLDDLESRLSEETEADAEAAWRRFWSSSPGPAPFRPSRNRQAPPATPWEGYNINDTLGADDVDRLLANQLCSCSDILLHGGGAPLTVRCNYGVGILPTIFGAEPFIMPRDQNCLPNVRHLGPDKIPALLKRGVPDLSAGYGGAVFRAAERFLEVLAPYPKAKRYIHLYHPDLQGPFDVCELLWGSDIFVDLYDETEMVHDLLALVCETYERFMERWWTLVPPGGDPPGGDPSGDGYHYHWTLMHRGRIVLRDDSAMNISPAMYDEFIFPYNQRLFDRLGGGGIHACGRVDHYVDRLARYDGLTFFNMSQPAYNDMEVVYRHTVDQGVRLLGLPGDAAEAAVAAGRDLHGLVHCY